MPLINCPDCGKPISDLARECKYCGLPVRVRLAQLRREEDERQAEEEAQQQRLQRQRNFYHGFLICIGIGIFLAVASCISNMSQHPVLQSLAAQGSQHPGGYAFAAHGKLQIDYSCQSSNERATTMQFSLVNMHATGAAATIWKKVVKCTTANQVDATQSDTIQVPSGTYDVGIVASASDTSWSTHITQA
jgi:hypothetical protein